MSALQKLRLAVIKPWYRPLYVPCTSFSSQPTEVKDVDWKWVERLLPPATVPPPPKKTEYASGWRPLPETPPEKPYFVHRTKNHMLPVYMSRYRRGKRRILYTTVRKIEGDVFNFEKDVREYLENKYNLAIATAVSEVSRKVDLKENYVDDIKQWLLQQGY